ncbi:UNVERIFIED_CONTAM: hypothetical protein NCL1_25363 [Trichonephila clavipes]
MGAAIPNVLQPGAFVWFEKTQRPLLRVLHVPGWRPMKQLAVSLHFLRCGGFLDDWSIERVLSLVFVMTNASTVFSWSLPGLVLYNFWHTFTYFNIPPFLNFKSLLYLLQKLNKPKNLLKNTIPRHKKSIAMQTNSTTQTTNNKINNFTQTICIQHGKQTETSILLQDNSSQTRILNQKYSTQTENEMDQSPAIENKNKDENNSIDHNITRSTNLDDFNRYFDLE